MATTLWTTTARRVNTTLLDLDLERTDLGLRALRCSVRCRERKQRHAGVSQPGEPARVLGRGRARLAGGGALGANAGLKTLKCGKWGLKHEGLETIVAYGLCENTTLETLDLRCNRVDELGGAHVARALRENKTLRRLNLEENKLGDAGAAVHRDGAASTTSLLRLDLRCNGIGDAGLARRTACALCSKTTRHRASCACGGTISARRDRRRRWRGETILARAEALGAAIKADITFRVVDGDGARRAHDGDRHERGGEQVFRCV